MTDHTIEISYAQTVRGAYGWTLLMEQDRRTQGVPFPGVLGDRSGETRPMTICKRCGQPLIDRTPCLGDALHEARDDGLLWPNPGPGECEGCWVPEGGFHERGCRLNICPHCELLAVVCECDWANAT